MRKFFAAAAATCMCSGVAFADTLTLEEQAFIRLSIRTVKVVQECKGFELVPGAVERDGASKGVDVLRIGGAIEQAVRLNQHMDYDLSKAIPEVTRLVNDTTNTLIDDEQHLITLQRIDEVHDLHIVPANAGSNGYDLKIGNTRILRFVRNRLQRNSTLLRQLVKFVGNL